LPGSFTVWRGVIFAKIAAAVFILVFKFGRRFNFADWLAFLIFSLLLRFIYCLHPHLFNTSERFRERVSEIKCFHYSRPFSICFQK